MGLDTAVSEGENHDKSQWILKIYFLPWFYPCEPYNI